jgi:hypothetical protein
VHQPAWVLSSKYEQLLQIKNSVDNLPVIPKLSTSLFIDKEIKKGFLKAKLNYDLKRPALKSSTACINSSLVFMTKGPY